MRRISTSIARASSAVRAVVVVASMAVVGLAAFIPLTANPRTVPREITLVARQMAFYLEGSDEPNPTLRLSPGEEVRLVLRNEEAGVMHDFVASSLRAAIAPLRRGATGSIEFRVPDQPGRYQYQCTPHARMMTGTIVVGD